MRHAAIPLLALTLALAACEPMPPGPQFSPVIAPRGTGVGLPPVQPISATPVTGTFAPDPAGPPIIEETLTDGTTGIVPPPATPLDPSIGAAVDAFGPAGAIGDTSGPAQTLPLGAPIATTPLGGGAPLPDAPFGTVPGGPLPDIQYRGGRIDARSPGYDDALAPAAPAIPGVASSAAAVTPAAAPGISDEQSFDAVQRRTIETDAERLAILRANRQEVAPEPVPVRPADAAPNIVRYAIAAPNDVGQRVHRRGGLLSMARLRDACARYASPDRAQEAFLAAGGPARDRHGLDPDGDGFACGWDPTPFRRALN